MMEPLGEIQRRLGTVESLVHDLRRDVDAVHQSEMPVAERSATTSPTVGADLPHDAEVPPVGQAEMGDVEGPTYVEQELHSTQALESMIGGRGLFYAGLGLVALAMVYFFKLAFDLWIGPVGRVALGLGVGAALIAVAFRFATHNRTFVTEGIFATGVVIEYFTIYAAFQLYHIFDPIMAYTAMIGVTVLSAVTSAQWKSERVAWFAAVGAFATPFMIAGHDADRLALAGYVAVVDLTFLAFARAMRWGKLPLTLLLGTLVLFWSGIVNIATLAPTTQAGIAVSYFVMFCVSKRYANREESPNTRIIIDMTELLNLAAAMIALKDIFPLDTQHAIISTFLLSVAVCQTTISRTVASRRLAFAPLALALQTGVTGDLIIPAFSLYTVALASFGHRFQDGKCRLTAYVGQAILLMYAFHAYAYFPSPVLILNERFAGYVCMAAGLFILSRLAQRSVSQSERQSSTILRLGGHMALLIAATLECSDFGGIVVGSMKGQSLGLMLSAVWSGFAFTYIVEGFLKKRNYMRWSGLGLLGIVMVKLLAVDLATFDLTFRIGSALAVGIVAILVAVLYQKRMGAQGDTVNAAL